MSLRAESSIAVVRVGRRPVLESPYGDRVWAQNDSRQELTAELGGNAIC